MAHAKKKSLVAIVTLKPELVRRQKGRTDFLPCRAGGDRTHDQGIMSPML